jgi:hypothetical protein
MAAPQQLHARMLQEVEKGVALRHPSFAHDASAPAIDPGAERGHLGDPGQLPWRLLLFIGPLRATCFRSSVFRPWTVAWRRRYSGRVTFG